MDLELFTVIPPASTIRSIVPAKIKRRIEEKQKADIVRDERDLEISRHNIASALFHCDDICVRLACRCSPKIQNILLQELTKLGYNAIFESEYLNIDFNMKNESSENGDKN